MVLPFFLFFFERWSFLSDIFFVLMFITRHFLYPNITILSNHSNFFVIVVLLCNLCGFVMYEFRGVKEIVEL